MLGVSIKSTSVQCTSGCWISGLYINNPNVGYQQPLLYILNNL